MQRRGARRDPVAPRGGASHGDLALDFHEVLDGDRDAVQRADGVAGADGFVGGLGGEAGVGRVDRNEGLEFRLQPFDAGQQFVDQIDRERAARGDFGGQGVDGEESGGGHGGGSVTATMVAPVAPGGKARDGRVVTSGRELRCAKSGDAAAGIRPPRPPGGRRPGAVLYQSAGRITYLSPVILGLDPRIA